MKKLEIVGLILVVVVIGAVVSTTLNLGDYATFSDAMEESDQEHTIIGILDVNAPIVYEPENNPSLTVFHAIDKDGKKSKVFLHEPKPQGFERSEEITITGKFKEGSFHASKMLMKCPSKYEDEKLEELDYDKNSVYAK